jgi:hypothetical protein
MNNHPISDNYNQTLPFSPFGNGASVLKMPVSRLSSKNLRQVVSSPRKAHRQATAEPIAEWRVVSPYHVDDYGRPRILSRLEVTLYALAWPVVIAVVIGYGLAISFVVIRNPSVLQPQQKTTQAQQFASQEIEP